jgi:hypothetical protein
MENLQRNFQETVGLCRNCLMAKAKTKLEQCDQYCQECHDELHQSPPLPEPETGSLSPNRTPTPSQSEPEPQDPSQNPTPSITPPNEEMQKMISLLQQQVEQQEQIIDTLQKQMETFGQQSQIIATL